jgi:tetratricopeptide (TPR) repeat protein
MDRAAAAFEALTDDPALSNSRGCILASRARRSAISRPPRISCPANAAGGISQTERVVRARAEILVQLGRRATRSTCWTATRSASPTPRFSRLQARIGAGAEGPYSFVTTWQEGISEVFFTVAQAFGPDGNGNLPLIYARAAYGISEKNTDALILAGEILMADEQYELAAETYGPSPETDDQLCRGADGPRRSAGASGRWRMHWPCCALAEASPDLAPIHAALGDTLRRAEMCEDAIESYTEALDRVDTASRATGSSSTPGRSATT